MVTNKIASSVANILQKMGTKWGEVVFEKHG
jgi:hypothetical protein